jgi:hypothetical protein
MHQPKNIRAVANNRSKKTRSTTCPARKVLKERTCRIFVTLNASCKIASGWREIVGKLVERVSETVEAFRSGRHIIISPSSCTSFGKSKVHVTYDSICKVVKASETACNTHRRQVCILHIDGEILKGTASTTCTQVSDDLQVFLGFFARCNRS